jgi:hydrogenase expression/formation protein HypC
MCLGIPGQVVEIIDVNAHRAVAEVDGVRREINVGVVLGEEGGLEVGDWVLIHVGFAMAKIDEEEAERTLSFIKELGAVYDDEIDQFRESTPL